MCYNFVLYTTTFVLYSYSISLYNKYVLMFGYICRLLFYILHLFVSTILSLFTLYLVCDALRSFFIFNAIVLFHVVYLLAVLFFEFSELFVVLFFDFVENWLPETYKPYFYYVYIKLGEFMLYAFKMVVILTYYISVFLIDDYFEFIRHICKSLIFSLCGSYFIFYILIPAIKLHYEIYRMFLDKLGWSSFAI